MTAILDEIRRLEAARKRGDMSASEYATARGRLLASVEDASLEDEPSRPTRATHARPAAHARSNARSNASSNAKAQPRRDSSPAAQKAAEAEGHPWGLVILGLGAAGIFTFLVGQLIGDITIAFTLMVTVFAAILIAAFQRMQQ